MNLTFYLEKNTFSQILSIILTIFGFFQVLKKRFLCLIAFSSSKNLKVVSPEIYDILEYHSDVKGHNLNKTKTWVN